MKSGYISLKMPSAESREPGIYGLIETVRIRPGMYLGSNSLTPLMHFINGYKFAQFEKCEVEGSDREYTYQLVPLDFKFFSEFTYLKFRDPGEKRGLA